MDADCHYGDHSWCGGGACVRCGKQLRCACGQFVTEDGLGRHIDGPCPLGPPPDQAAADTPADVMETMARESE